MKIFEVMFCKPAKILGPGTQVMTFAKQTIQTDSDKLNIPVPEGYAIVSVTEILPVIIQKDEKVVN